LTRRRQDAPSLPRRKVTVRTTGQVYTAPDGKAYRPSMFLTLTCDSYGKVRDDGTPADPRRSAPGHRVSQVTKPSRSRLLALLGGGLGLRQGEALSLAVNRVDAAAGMVRVDQQVVLISRRPVLAPPNTMASVRYVPLPRFVADAIMQQVAAFDLELDEVLCRTPRGNLLRRDYYNAEIWRPAILAAGLPADTTFHDLRHTFASRALAEGVPISEVSRWLGHKSITTTVDLYGHLVPEASERARDALDRVFAEANVPPMCPNDSNATE
jgi:integrase